MNSFFIRNQSVLIGAILGIGIGLYTFVPALEELKRETNRAHNLSKVQSENNSNIVSNKEAVVENKAKT
ncbi:1095_t:CDS:2 [Funneliformis geosporum]|uniref:1095_t:CDS:1 n=1 Tax=Funneliformis geosporum TaxID=1117311 RepID=A0A9W4WWS5_9GLOM|nr:1095_t:CDS:2 [Funneliformis geosporum]